MSPQSYPICDQQVNKVEHREMMLCGAVCVVFYRGGQREDCATPALLYAVLYKPIKNLKLTRWRELKRSPNPGSCGWIMLIFLYL